MPPYMIQTLKNMLRKFNPHKLDLPRVAARVFAMYGVWKVATWMLDTQLRLQSWCCCRAVTILCSTTIIEA